jgi:Mor family transcriptional regulator
MKKIIFKNSPISYSLNNYIDSFEDLKAEYHKIYKNSKFEDFVRNEKKRYRLYIRNCETYYKFAHLPLQTLNDPNDPLNLDKFVDYPYSDPSDIITDIAEKVCDDDILREDTRLGFRNILNYLSEISSIKKANAKKDSPTKGEKINQPSRDKTFKNLIDGSEMIQLFQKYEKQLIIEGFLSDNREKWLKNTASFMRFYNYCESKKVFKYFHEDSSSGVNMLRDLYNHHEGMKINNRDKRLKQSEVKRHKGQFDFLNDI